MGIQLVGDKLEFGLIKVSHVNQLHLETMALIQ